MRLVADQVIRLQGKPATPGAFYRDMRTMALDGFVVDVPDTPANERAFGRPGSSRAPAAFPQARVLSLCETGSHVLWRSLIKPCSRGEVTMAHYLLRRLQPGMLLLWDRNFHSYRMVQATLARGAHCLGRAKTNLIFEPTELLSDGSFLAQLSPDAKARRRDAGGVTVRVIEYALDTAVGPGTERYRLVTSLLDEHAFPAETLAATYHERWEVETALDEVKVHQWAHPKPLRSQHPREVVQEVYGLLLAHLAIRAVMHQAALQQGVDPDRLSFTGALHVLRRAIPRAQRTWPEAFPLFRPTS
jgi:Transposase DDE domain